MKSPLLVVLGISSTLLGLYILLISLFSGTEKQPDYHIGCYLTEHSHHNSFNFKSRLQQLNFNGQQSRNFHSRIKNSQLNDPQLNIKSVQLTKNVDLYIQNLALVKKYQETNMNYFTQLSVARQAYESCAYEIKDGINIQESKQLWSSYQKCFDQSQEIKDKMDGLYSQRSGVLSQIDRLLNSKNPKKPNNENFDLEAELKRTREQYEKNNSINDKNKKNYMAELSRVQFKTQEKIKIYEQLQSQYQRTKVQLDLCSKNLKQFKKCENITRTIKQYGSAQSFQSLQQKIKSKRQMLIKLRSLVIQAREDGVDNKAITEMYGKRQKQLIQTIRIRLDMGYEGVDECGCSEARRKELQSQFNSLREKRPALKVQIDQLREVTKGWETKIKETDKIRGELVKKFREQTEKIKNSNKPIPHNLEEQLSILRLKLSEINEKLTQFSSEFNSLEFKCNQYKDRLALKLKDSETVADCFSKREFYNKLKSKAQHILKKDGASESARQNVMKTLQSFTYPKQIQYPIVLKKEQISIGQEKLQNGHKILEVTQKQKVEISIENQVVIEKIEEVEQVVVIQEEQNAKQVSDQFSQQLGKTVEEEAVEFVREDSEQVINGDIVITRQERIKNEHQEF